MKRKISTILAATLLTGAAMPAVSHAAMQQSVGVILNGKTISFPDAKPYVNDTSRTMVPVRFITETIGAQVKWDGGTQTVTILYKDKTITLKAGEKRAVVNAEDKDLDAPVTLKDSRTFVPLRFVSESLDSTVTWEPAIQTVVIKTADYVPDPNVKFDPFGRRIRTTNLPKNASEYPYILEGIPNAMYEMKHPHSTSEAETAAQIFRRYPDQTTKANQEGWMANVRGYYNTMLNVDYRTIDNSFVDVMWSHMIQGVNHRPSLQSYVDWVKKNHVQLEGQVVPEPSTIYESGFGYFIRASYQYRVLNFDDKSDVFYDTYYSLNDKIKIQKGVWYKGYVDISVGTMDDDWGSTLKVSALSSLFDNDTNSMQF